MSDLALAEPEAPLRPDASPAIRGIDPAVLPGVLDLREWLIADSTKIEDGGEVLTGFAERLNALGLPIDRIATAIEALHSEYAGIGRSWTREDGASVRLLPHGMSAARPSTRRAPSRM